jgi:hypothetical protein
MRPVGGIIPGGADGQHVAQAVPPTMPRGIAMFGGRCLLTSVVILLPVAVAPAAEFRQVVTADSIPGWQVRKAPVDSWVVKDGVLTCTSTGGLWGGWIGSTAEYTDLILELEFKVAPGANSGVYLRAPNEGHVSELALEIQILDDYAEQYKTLKPSQFCGAIYKVVAPSRRVSRPAGEWNRMRITAIGDHIEVELNGERVIDADSRSHPELARRSARGFIGFQDHHSRVWFRNVRLADLSGSSTKPAASRPTSTFPAASRPASATAKPSEPPRIRVGAYWWDGWFEGSPYIREPLTREFKDREPIWGWRDDSQTAVDTSIRLAARYGVDFFAFLWYPETDWKFPGGQPSGVMNNGLNYYLASRVPERERVGFLLMIAHAPKSQDWERACRVWARTYWSHERYVRVEGRPAVFFYDLAALGDKLGGRDRVRPALQTLRRIAREEHCPDPFLVLRAQGQEPARLRELGFDGATDYAIAYTPTAGEHPYADLVATGQKRWAAYAGRRCNYIPSVTAGWDGRPRAWMRKKYYAYWYRRSPSEFGAFVRDGLAWLRSHPQDVPTTPLLMVYAWNEVDEGGAICPTRQDGPAYLDALQAAINMPGEQ